MPTVRQILGYKKVSAGRSAATPAVKGTVPRPLKLVQSGMSAIEYIVATARPGEVIHITDEEYYNPHLWRSYQKANDPP